MEARRGWVMRFSSIAMNFDHSRHSLKGSMSLIHHTERCRESHIEGGIARA